MTAFRAGANDARDALLSYAQSLGDDEVRVLAMLAARLAMGQRQYGRLDVQRDNRVWAVELMEELADAAVYGVAAIMRLRRGGGL